MAEISPDGNEQTTGRLPEGSKVPLPSVQSLCALLDAVPGVVWEAWGQPDAAHQRINYVSDYVEKMTGYSVEEWIATPNFWLQIVHPNDRERAAKETAAIFASGGSGMVSFRWITRSQQILWMDAYSTVIFDTNGQPAGMRGVTMDVTAQKVQVSSLVQRLRESVLQTQDRIGNNLQFIASLLEEHILEYPDAVPIAELRQVSLRLGMLAEVQTVVTKAFREHDDMDHIPVHQVLEVLPDMYTLEARFRPLQIETDEIFLTASRVNSLAIIASELISNAYRYGKGVVTIRLRRKHDHLVFTVSDEGDGFPENFKPHEGLNTGLNLVKSMAWSGLMGHVVFKNAPEGGACIVVNFPPSTLH